MIWLRQALKRLAGSGLADAMIGDLLEERQRRADRGTAFLASAWFWCAAVSLICGVLWIRTIERGRAMASVFWFGLTNHRDLRRIARSWWRSPWYAATAIVVIGLTSALAAATFAIVDGLLFKPFPYRHADELYIVSAGYSDALRARTGATIINRWGLGLSLRDMQDLAAAVPGTTYSLIGGGASDVQFGDMRVWAPIVARVDAHFFDVTGVRPAVGGFAPEDFTTPASGTVPVLIGQALWRTQFDRRPDVVGQTLRIADGPRIVTYVVRGVLPADFVSPSPAVPNVLAPFVPSVKARADRSMRNYQFLVRRPPDVSIEEMQARFNAVMQAVRAELPDHHENGGAGPTDIATLRPLAVVATYGRLPQALAAFVAAMTLLGLGAVSVSGLIAGRVNDRGREVAMRRALGATNGQIATMVGAEVWLIATIGSVLGLVGAVPALRVVTRLLPPNAGLLKTPAIDWRVAGFSIVCLIATAAVAAFWPTVRMTRVAVVDARRDRTRTVGRFCLVAIDVALGLLLTVGGTLLVSSLVNVWQEDLGFRPSDVTVIEATATGEPAARKGMLDGFLDELRRVPGVVAAGATTAPLLRRSFPGGEFRGDTYPISAGFVDAWAPILRAGRWPTADEIASDAPVVVVSERGARMYFGDTNVVGRLLEASASGPLTVIGVAADVRMGSWDDSSGLGGQFYRPLTTVTAAFSLAIRSRGGQNVIDAARNLPSVANGTIRLRAAADAESLLAETIRARRLRAWLAGVFAVAGLAILAAGLLGMIAMDVSQRTREIGIRCALGARTKTIVGLLFREPLASVCAGLSVGSVIAWWAMQLLKDDLYRVSIDDVWMWALSSTILLTVAAVATLIPLCRVRRVQPAVVLRAE
jgi:predicted permease